MLWSRRLRYSTGGRPDDAKIAKAHIFYHPTLALCREYFFLIDLRQPVDYVVMHSNHQAAFIAHSQPQLTLCLPCPRSSPTSKRNLKLTPSTTSPSQPFMLAGHPTAGPPEGTYGALLPPNLPPSSRKRKVSDLNPFAPPSISSSAAFSDPGGLGEGSGAYAEPMSSTQSAKKSRTNTPWSPAEEQRLKTMRDAGSSWSEIAKVGPNHDF